MADFETALRYAVEKFKVTFELRPEQKEALRYMFDLHDAIAVLPTGFGKSLIYQLLPYMYQAKFSTDKPMIVIIATPLNSIMENQVMELKHDSLSACYMSYDGTGGATFDDVDSDDEFTDGTNVVLPKTVTYKDLQKGNYELIYAHPEALQTREMQRILRSQLYQRRVGAVVVDEVHMISEWGEEFRPAFKKLGNLTCLFPTAGHMALTATATPSRILELSKILEYSNHKVVSVNPDRPNINIEIRTRLANLHKYEKLDQIINPLASELKEIAGDFPVTIVYMENLEALGYCYKYLDSFMGQEQYRGEPIPENRVFAQYHKDYTTAMKSHIIQELSKTNPKLRLVLATVALGMGLNAPAISRVIHCRPPTTLEAFMQEIGRAGRKGQAAHAVMYFNNNDLSKARKGLSDKMIEFCRSDVSCLRLQLVKYFGFDKVLYSGDPEGCCSNCKKHC